MPRRKKNGHDTPQPTDGGEDAPQAGHNIAGIAGERLRSFIERVERLEEEKRTVAADIKEVYAEARGTGFDPKIMRMLIKERRMDADDLREQQDTLDIYKRALGMFVDTPLGAAAIQSAQKPKTAPPHAEARDTGFSDGFAGHMDHAAKWPAGEYGHGDYGLGWAQGQAQRVEHMTDVSGA